jgi:amino-acid N-acetyltransferase
LGKKLVNALEAAAQVAGIKDLWLLTIDAERYFATLGYVIVARDAVPEAIRLSDEFAELCPDSAHLMMKDLHTSEL